jgi:DNA-binding MarR family transcriptional regulator
METKWLTDDERDIWRNFMLMHLQLSARLNRELAPTGLSYQDYLVMASLSDRSDDRMRVVELGDELGWEKSRISHHISRMCERGLVRKERCPTDQRGMFVILTAQGRRAITHAAPTHVASVRRYVIDVLRRDQLSVLDDVARSVLESLASPDWLARIHS